MGSPPQQRMLTQQPFLNQGSYALIAAVMVTGPDSTGDVTQRSPTRLVERGEDFALSVGHSERVDVRHARDYTV